MTNLEYISGQQPNLNSENIRVYSSDCCCAKLKYVSGG